MSNGYDRKTPIPETSPLLHGEDLLNGYEQSKYVSDKMVWTAFQERGIPGAIYRPPLISGLSDGTYHKLDEFLPQVFKGCLQLQCFPALDSLWEVAPIDFVSKSIVHIAQAPKNLNRAYFITHPDSRSVSDYIDWHQRVGFVLRAAPWEIWKKEFLDLGPEMIRKNALAPFVDFIEAMSQAQVFFPLVDSRQFREAIRDLAIVPPPALKLLERYTRHFISSGFYDEVPGVPAELKAPSRDKAVPGVATASAGATAIVAGNQSGRSASGQP
jgi:thioester reductase-like protein